MSFFNYTTYMTPDVLSVEVNSDGFSFPSNQFDTPCELDLSPLFDIDMFTPDMNLAGVCESNDLAVSMSNPAEVNEFDKYFGPKYSSNSTYDIDQNLLVLNSLPMYGTGVEKQKKGRSNKKPISLSESVAVGVPQRSSNPSNKIEIVCDLEQTYRPRYKSDYFAQNGRNRKPRYVSDRHGSHYVTLRVPPGIRGQIRVDWLTLPNENGGQFFMPYRFQTNNESNDAVDVNPIMEDIVSDGQGMIKLYLVLIKAKQDALKLLQPLKPFRPWQDALGIINKHAPEKTTMLTPKKLIQKYQLGKSQLAFTLCTPSADGQSYIPDWNTTVYSTVLEEESADNSTGKTVACPNCLTPLTISDDGLVIEEVTVNKRKDSHIGNEKIETIKKQRSLSRVVYGFD